MPGKLGVEVEASSDLGETDPWRVIATKLEAVTAGKVKPTVVMSLEPFHKERKNHKRVKFR